MTMDNLQRTEHFLSYCPELINVSESLSQKEAVKRLSMFNSLEIIVFFNEIYF
jgi:hypothetical protein